MNKVEKCINDTTEWLNNIINIQAKQNLDQDPAVRVNEIRRKLREIHGLCDPIVNQPKPQIDSPKQEAPPDASLINKTEELEEEIKNIETTQQNGDCHMNESPVSMDLD
ncbi:PREDICTED: heat shock protein 105 kDa-like [Thamnophis sirtalis]|nr:PREDICTED: heat shock protein 105 kDa-like [Thamnophis sirtalis]